jgi:acyl carrier protein
LNDMDEFIALVRDQLGLPVTVGDAGTELDQLPGWDSLHLLHLLTVLEQRTGREISLPDLLDVSTLEGIYRMAVTP